MFKGFYLDLRTIQDEDQNSLGYGRVTYFLG